MASDPTGECNDANAAINPGATEVCDGVDNDCDTEIDENVINTYYEDEDGDGYFNGNTQNGCSVPGTGWYLSGDIEFSTGMIGTCV